MKTNEQFQTAFDILTAYYGLPAWELKPKEGQSREEIIRIWCDELQVYSVEQVRAACAWLTRRKKTMIFPTLNLLLCELIGQEPLLPTDKKAEARRCYDYIRKNNPLISPSAARRAVRRIYHVTCQEDV